MDGHSGIENSEANKGDSQHFQFVLSFLISPSGRKDFIIHASTNVAYGPEPHPLEYLQNIGFEPFGGNCPFFHNGCLWRHMLTVETDQFNFADMRSVESAHTAFKSFVDNIEELYRLFQHQNDILRKISAATPYPKIFATPPILKVDTTEIPRWADPIRFERLSNLEKQQAEIQKEILDLQEYLPLLYTDGDILVSAALKSLKLFNLKVELAVKGFTVDILAETPDGTKKFGIEVTGCNEAIKKESKKLTQILGFDMKKEHNEKTILIANTFKNIPIEEREGKEHFTKNVVDFLGKHPILLMTGYDMYQMVRDVLEEKRSGAEIIEILYKKEGVLKYGQ
jgi:hypothetical protein